MDRKKLRVATEKMENNKELKLSSDALVSYISILFTHSYLFSLFSHTILIIIVFDTN